MTNASAPFFTLETTAEAGNARAGIVRTDHGDIQTPIFMPVGTQGTVKALQQRELVELNAQIILGNTYHLYLRPGEEILGQLGGLHRFMNWERPILTDSGGFQVFSLQELRKLSEQGVEFASHIDGSRHMFTPESVVDTQRCIGSDIMMVLDECTPHPSTHEYVRDSMRRSARWAQRCMDRFKETNGRYGARQFLFAIGQGGVYEDLRRENMHALVDMDFPGYAIGGLSVGEETGDMYAMTAASTAVMPADKPRYLMGVGTPENLLECIDLGVDMFDCVMPTRNARNGQLFTTQGPLNLRNAKHKMSDEAIDPVVNSYASNNFSRAYMRHLFKANEILALQLATHHNIAFYLWLMRTARTKILAGQYRQWKNEFLAGYRAEKPSA